MKKIFKSFEYASDGISYVISSQRNMKIHTGLSLAVLFLAMAFHLHSLEAMLVIIAIGIVTAAESLNTAIEKTVDLITRGKHPLAKAAKDAAAGAVLLTAFASVGLGIIVFLPYFRALANGSFLWQEVEGTVFFTLEGLFLIIFTYWVKAFWYRREKRNEPSILLAIVVYLICLFSILNIWLFYLIIGLTLPIVVFLWKTGISTFAVLQNGIISIGGFYIIYWLLY